MALDTAVTIIQRVSAEVGLPVAADPFSSSDPNQVLLLKLLDGAGRELVGVYQWPELDQVCSLDFSLSGGVGRFYLPDDWGYIHNQTIWDTTTPAPVAGPIPSSEWYATKNAFAASSPPTSMCFRITGSLIEFLPDPSPVTTVVELEYTSSYWIEKASGTRAVTPTAGDDLVLIDSRVVSRLVKLRWLESKEMNTVGASADFRGALDDVTSKASGARVLYLGRSSVRSLLGYANVPETGYGL
jgi:hypothetical protein